MANNCPKVTAENSFTYKTNVNDDTAMDLLMKDGYKKHNRAPDKKEL